MFLAVVLPGCSRLQVGKSQGLQPLLQGSAGPRQKASDGRKSLGTCPPCSAQERRRDLTTEALCVTGSPASGRGCLAVEGLKEAEVVDLRPL